MPVEIEEADIARRIAQVPQECGARRRTLLEEREIEVCSMKPTNAVVTCGRMIPDGWH
jgi:hypothetical protein